jgi:hypothetical protein
VSGSERAHARTANVSIGQTPIEHTTGPLAKARLCRRHDGLALCARAVLRIAAQVLGGFPCACDSGRTVLDMHRPAMVRCDHQAGPELY